MNSTAGRPLPPQGLSTRPASQDAALGGAPSPAGGASVPVAHEGHYPAPPPPGGAVDGSHPYPGGPSGPPGGGGMNHEGAAGGPPPGPPMYRYGPPPPQVYRYGPPPPHQYHKMPPVTYDGRGPPVGGHPGYDGRGPPGYSGRPMDHYGPPGGHHPGHHGAMPMHVPSHMHMYPPPHHQQPQMMYYPPPQPQSPHQPMKNEGPPPPGPSQPQLHPMMKNEGPPGLGFNNGSGMGNVSKPAGSTNMTNSSPDEVRGDKDTVETPQGSDTVSNTAQQNPKGDTNDNATSKEPQDDEHDMGAAGQSTVTKPKGVKKEADDSTPATAATATTCNETMSQISPQVLNTSRDSSSSSGGNSQSRPPMSHMYQTHQKPPPSHLLRSPPQSSPSHYSHGSRGSFSQITNPPSASAFYNTVPPPPNSTLRRHQHPQSQPYMYQYQHFDPRSHVDVPMPPKRNMNDVPRNATNDGYYGNGSMVPPTVHLPNAPGLKDLSPLNFASAIKSSGASGGAPLNTHALHATHINNKTPATPRATRKESEAASTMAQLQSGDKRNAVPKGSPLDLLSSVSASPAAPGKQQGAGPSYMSQPHHPGHVGSNHPTYSYPPAPSYPSQHQYHQEHHHQAVKTEEPPQPPVDATPAPKSSSLCDLILSAANTLDHEDTRNRKRKLMLADDDDDDDDMDIRKNLLKKAPAPTNLFSVGGYPPGFDPSTLPPSRSSLKPAPKSHHKGKIIDPDTVTQAAQASMLAQQALERPRVGKQLLLSMALVRTNPRTPPSCYPAHGTILTDRFHWAAFPPLDTVLRKHMKQYYELSTNKCQSRDQQEFNNDLVLKVRGEAKKYGWEFDDKAFDDKKIRDRIRCFFKTHIQNAKKRLKTMLRNPEKRANIKALAAHFHLIEEKGVDPEHDHDSDDDEMELGFGLSQSYSSELGDSADHHRPSSYGSENNHHDHQGDHDVAAV